MWPDVNTSGHQFSNKIIIKTRVLNFQFAKALILEYKSVFQY